MSADPLGNSNLSVDVSGNHAVTRDNGNDNDIKVDGDHHGHLDHLNVPLNVIATTQEIPNQSQLPSVVDINQSNLIFTNDGAIYVMVRPPDHGNIAVSVNQNLGVPSVLPPSTLQTSNPSIEYHPINPGMEVTPVHISATTFAAGPMNLFMPDEKRKDEVIVGSPSAFHHSQNHFLSNIDNHNKRIKYGPQEEMTSIQSPPSLLSHPTSRVYSLYLELDERNLSQFQCLARKQIEVFEASADDTIVSAQGRNRPILLGQVGIRCRHCHHLPPKHRKTGSVYFPTRLDGVYQTAQKMITNHLLQCCPVIPDETRKRLVFLKDQKSSDGGGKNYWAESVRKLSVVETRDGLSFAVL
jgi:hypothetical protein